MVDAEGMKTILKVGDAKRILSNISEIVEGTVFVWIDEISVFFLTTNLLTKPFFVEVLHGYRRFCCIRYTASTNYAYCGILYLYT